MSRVQLTDSAANVISITAGAQVVIDPRQFVKNPTMSVSTGTILNAPGMLFGFMGTTGGGNVNFIASGQSLGNYTVSAGVMVSWPAPIYFTSLTASSSVGVYTLFYTAL